MDIANVSKAAALMREAQSILGNGPLDYYLSEIAASYNLLMQRFAPYKVGDRIALSVTPEITPEGSPGWMCCRHFLVKGAKGIVREATCGSNGFRFAIEFDDESWIDQKGKIRHTESKSVFYFGESHLTKPHR